MIHYHGMPIAPATAAVKVLEAGHAFISYASASQVGVVVEVCQSFAIDNGAFSNWRAGNPTTDWSGYYEWAGRMKRIPSCDFAVVPDVIDGTEGDNDTLLGEWPLGKHFGAPVWHMHESLDRLERLASDWPRICLGSSGEFSRVGSAEWWVRMGEAMGVLCNPEGEPSCRLHGLRMLDPRVFTRLPLSSADSTNIGRNLGIDSKWKGTYLPPTKEARAQVMRSRVEAHNSPARWGL